MALTYAHMDNTFTWLKLIGVVPPRIEKMNLVLARVDLNPRSIDAGYLAAVSYEWDSWGASSPVDLMRALGCEVRDSSKRDIVQETLVALGKVRAEDAA